MILKEVCTYKITKFKNVENLDHIKYTNKDIMFLASILICKFTIITKMVLLNTYANMVLQFHTFWRPRQHI